MLKYIASSISALVLSFSAFAQTDSAPIEDIPIEGIAATVNDVPISYTDVRNRARLLLSGLRSQPDEETIQRATLEALNQLIEEQLKLQEAAQFDLVVEQEAIDREIARTAQQAGIGLEQFYNELAQFGVNPSTLENQMRAEIAWRRIMGGRFGSRIRISQDKIDDHMHRMHEQFEQKQYQVSEIFLYAADEVTKQQAYAGAQQLMQQIREGAPFQVVAQRLSSSSTAAVGGDMGWVTLDQLDPILADAIAPRDQPGILGPIVAEDGIYILAVRGFREPLEDLDTIVELMEVIATDGSEETLRLAMEDIDNCLDAQNAPDDFDGLKSVYLGRVPEKTLSGATLDLLNGVDDNEPTDFLSLKSGPAVLYVCGRAIEGGDVPTRRQMEDQLYGEELGMISERELRNLERNALIVRR